MKTIIDTNLESTVQTNAITPICEKTNLDGIEVSNLTATLPKPPSINHIYGYTCNKGFATSYITKEGRLWFEEAGWRLKPQMSVKTPIIEPCAIVIDLFTTRITQQDGDNILKPTLDLLQKQGIVKNDALFYDIRVRKHKAKKGEERIEITLTDLDTSMRLPQV